MMYDLENIESGGQSLEQGVSGRLTDTQEDYLRELMPDEQSWEGMSDAQRDEAVSDILQRYGELNLPADFNLHESIGKVFDQRIVEQYERLEAPQDYVQIEAVGETLANCEELRWENWQNLELSEKV